MNTKIRLFTGAVALALAATSVLFTASDASARPYDYDRYNGNGNGNGAAWWKRDRYNDPDYYRYSQTIYINQPYQPYQPYQVYPSNTIVRLPYGCRRVVYRDRTYYTRDNKNYYTYDSNRRGFIVVNFSGLRIGF